MTKLLITSTFTSEPLETHLRFWFDSFEEKIDIGFSPYNQVFQEMLDKSSLFHEDEVINVLLVRFEDVVRDSKLANSDIIDVLDEYFRNLKNYFDNKRKQKKIIIGFFPNSEHYINNDDIKKRIKALSEEWFSYVLGIPGVIIVDFAKAIPFFNVNKIFDLISDREAHIPFSNDFFALMGTEIARKIRLFKQHEFKVIILDCDNTLWKGVCGEVGVKGIEINENFRSFQNFLIERQKEGMLLTLCSKNNIEDVQVVFEEHPDMLITNDHIVAQRINWQNKSENIKSMAEELNLGLDSFIFFDDNHMECLEVMEKCPQVLTLHLSGNMESIDRYLYHIWSFDKLKITQEDRDRSRMYISEKKRKQSRREVKSLESYLSDLSLKMWANFLDNSKIERASQLTQRTNQFNLSTIRRNVDELEVLFKDDKYQIWSIEVADKFGDYGFSGLIILNIQENKYIIDTFLLSCRVLGRSVENAILDLLVNQAKENGKKIIEADFIATQKNKPFEEFIENTGWTKILQKKNLVKYQINVDSYKLKNKYVHTYINEGCRNNGEESMPSSFKDSILESGESIKGQINLTEIDHKDFDLSIYDNCNILHEKELLPLKYCEAGKIADEVFHKTGLDIIQRAEYLEPKSTIEKKVAQIYSSILNIKKAGLNDHFFNLGGNSLQATYLVSRIYKDFNVSIGLIDVFNHPEIGNLSQIIANAKKHKIRKIEPINNKEYYSISQAQKNMFFLSQVKGIGSSYIIPKVFILKGSLNRDRLETAFRRLISHYEVLRTSFSIKDGKPVQIVHTEVSFRLENIPYNNEHIDMIMDNFDSTFKLDNAPLFRAGLVQMDKQQYYLLLNFHHIISDGTTLNILLKKLAEYYQTQEKEEAEVLHYKDFAYWQNSLFMEGHLGRQQKKLVEKFRSDIPILNLPYDYKRPASKSYTGAQHSVILNETITTQLKRLAQKENSTLFMVLLSIYSILLAKYSGQEDLCIGIPVAGRSATEMENAPGVFINTIVVRLKPSGEKEYISYLNELKKEALEGFSNQNVPFEALIEKLNISRDPSRNPLFDVMFIMQNMDSYTLELMDLEINNVDYHNKSSKMDITCEVWEKNNQLIINFEYCTKLFQSDTISRFAENYITLTESLCMNPYETIANQEMISKEEKELILSDFNDTSVLYDRNKTINKLFEERVRKQPEKIALEYKDISLTYKDLNIRANRLASRLLTEKVSIGDLVGILLNRGPELIISMMAVLKVGAAYVPLDPTYPSGRLEYMLQDSGARVLISNKNLVTDLEFSGQIVEPVTGPVESDSYVNPQLEFNSFNLAYVIYTSGSTGKPKGVMIEHINVHNFIIGMRKKIDFSPGQSILALTTACFDIFVLETLLPLTQGLKIYIGDEKEQQDSRLLSRCIVDRAIDIVQMTPSHMHLLFKGEGNYDCLRGVKSLLVGGEALPEKLLVELNGLEKTRIYNVYGPTETTVWSSVRDITGMSKVDIGNPIANTLIQILDKNNKLQPIGVVGEICIGGDGVARGYHKKLDLTKEKFIDSPFLSQHRIYKTGDLGRWLTDGNIQCLGRLDHQVKIRGHRIELDEIQKTLSSYTTIKDCVVIVDESAKTGKRLVAYYVAENEIPVNELRLYLVDLLPDYMVPELYMKIDSIPLTLNGKIDRKALKPASEVRPNMGIEFKEGETEIEKELVSIWGDVLERESIGIYDNFFDLGGNSMLIVAMCSQIGKKYEGLVDVTDVFANSTIYKLAKFIEKASIGDSSDVHIDELLLPEDFYHSHVEDSDEELLEFELGISVLNQLHSLASEIGIDFFEIALGCFIYILSELGSIKSFHVQVARSGKGNEAANLRIDISEISDLLELFTLVHNALFSSKKYDLMGLEKVTSSKSIYGCIPLVGEDIGMVSTLMGVFDVIVNIDGSVVKLKYNCGRLKESKMMEMMESYNGLFNLIAENKH